MFALEIAFGGGRAAFAFETAFGGGRIPLAFVDACGIGRGVCEFAPGVLDARGRGTADGTGKPSCES